MTDAIPASQASTSKPSPLRPFSFHGEALVAHVSGALLWPGQRALVVSDLHLEKGAAFARAGTFLPPYDSDETLNRLEALITSTRARTVISLGDSFHNRAVIDALSDDLLGRVQRLTSSVDRFVWVTGNHDPEVPAYFGGEVHEDLTLEGLHFRHEASPLFPAPGEISGHWHPKATIRGPMGRPLTRSCFIHNDCRLILPAFGTFTGGLNVNHPSITALFAHNSNPAGTGLANCALYLMGKRQIAAVRGQSLVQ